MSWVMVTGFNSIDECKESPRERKEGGKEVK